MDPSGSRSRPALHPVFTGVADVTVVLLGIDWRFRPLLEPIERYAVTASAETRQPSGPALGEIGPLLWDLRAGWVLSGAFNGPPNDGELAEQAYLGAVRVMVDRAFGTPQVQQPRFSGGVYRDGAPSKGGLSVAVLVAAAPGSIFDVARAADASQLGTLLGGLASYPGHRLAELILFPAMDEEPLSFDDVRARFPEMRPVDSNTMGPRTRCRRCGATTLLAPGACRVCREPLGHER